MTEEEYFRKTYPDFCYSSGKPLSPYWDLFQDGVEFGERQSEKKIEELELELTVEKDLHQEETNLHLHAEDYIKELEKENAELKKQLEMSNKVYNDNLDYSHHIEEQLTKAKDHIKKLLDCLKQDTNDPQTNYYVCQYMDKAEQFLKEIEK